MTQCWNFASYIPNLFAERWVRRAVAWKPLPARYVFGKMLQVVEILVYIIFECFCAFVVTLGALTGGEADLT